MVKQVGGYVSIKDFKVNSYFKEEFMGVTQDKQTTFPKGLGAEHPFNFEDVEKVVKKYGVLAGALNKLSDSVVTDFRVKLKNPNAQKIIDDFIHDTNLHTILNAWVKEGFGKGNGFIEIDLKESKVRIMNANGMYIKRNNKGKVLEYTQWVKSYNRFTKDSKDLITFKPNQIAHLTINKIPNDPYGIGIVWSNERIIENLINNEQDLQKLTTRKAGQPYHIKVGQPGSITPQSVVDNVNQALQYLTTRTEWVTDADVEIKVIDFPNLGKNITETQMYFYRMLLAGLEVPEVMMGSGQLNEGIALTQLKSYDRKIKSIQNQVSDIIEEKIIKPILLSNNLFERPLFIWNLPDQTEINAKLDRLNNFLLNPFIQSSLKARIQIELAELLGYEDIVNKLQTPDNAQQDEDMNKENEERRKEEEEIPEPEVPGVKPAAQSSILTIKEFVRKVNDEYCVFSHKTGRNMGCYKTKMEADKRLDQLKRFQTNDITIKEWIELKEVSGFNYTDYLVSILSTLKLDKFDDLKALTEKDVIEGLLSTNDIDKLREILKSGFINNQTIREIEKEIKNNIDLKDRITDKSVISSEVRPNMIARTETVRLANEGLLNLYKDNQIEKVSFLAALSDRTCPICEGLNGRVYKINESHGVIPVHTNCRCTWISIIE